MNTNDRYLLRRLLRGAARVLSLSGWGYKLR